MPPHLAAALKVSLAAISSCAVPAPLAAALTPSLDAWCKRAIPSRPPPASAHSPPGCTVQADTQFQPLAQQLLERHKPELCSQPPQARDIRMVCPSRGGESRCRPSCRPEGGRGLPWRLSAGCQHPADNVSAAESIMQIYTPAQHQAAAIQAVIKCCTFQLSGGLPLPAYLTGHLAATQDSCYTLGSLVLTLCELFPAVPCTSPAGSGKLPNQEATCWQRPVGSRCRPLQWTTTC